MLFEKYTKLQKYTFHPGQILSIAETTIFDYNIRQILR